MQRTAGQCGGEFMLELIYGKQAFNELSEKSCGPFGETAGTGSECLG
jgi:hypothetical protein